VSEQAFRPEAVSSSWTGYHDSTCSWGRTNAAYGDPTADATCALVERTNTNFGTVTTYTVTNPEPGIVFTPKRLGKYYVCALAKLVPSTGQTPSARLWDGTTVIAETEQTISASGTQMANLCGIYNATALTATTLSIQIKQGTGTINIQTAANSSAVEWSIYSLEQQFPAPVLVGSITSAYTGALRMEAANINCDAGSAITSQFGSWVSSVANISSGQCDITIASGVFSSAPYCWAQPQSRVICRTGVASTTSANINCMSDAAVNSTTFDAYFICVGPR
jgi:hypothetical protein